jgi:hypothetical protein
MPCGGGFGSLNGAIRAVVLAALEKGCETYCIYEEFGAPPKAKLYTQVQMAINEDVCMNYDGYVRVMQSLWGQTVQWNLPYPDTQTLDRLFECMPACDAL